MSTTIDYSGLDVDSLLCAAPAQTGGLDGFGDDGFGELMAALVESARTETP